jgi:hypothetical protein
MMNVTEKTHICVMYFHMYNVKQLMVPLVLFM